MSDEPRKPGRPPLDPRDPSVKVCFSLPSRQYDSLFEQAARERTSVGDVIRRQLQRDEDDE